MHSVLSRAQVLVNYGLVCLVLVFAAVAVGDTLNSPSPTFEAQVLNINRFRNKANGDDEVSLMLDISADLESLFTFNTKQVYLLVAAEYETAKHSLNQVSLWDNIISSRKEAKFQIGVKNKYHFVDQGSNLRGKEFNLTLHWHVMPKTGRMLAGKIVTSGFRLPLAYK